MNGLGVNVPSVGLDDVTFSYPGPTRRAGVVAVDGATGTIEAGTINGLVGINGAGKTTLLDLIAGALHPDRGTILLFGSPDRDRRLNGRIALCQDVPPLPDFLTVREALEFGCSLQGASAAESRSRVNDLVERLELGPLLTKRCGTLSRGNRVRVGLGLALTGRPEVLLLDEVFGPLDPLAQRLVREVLSEEARRGTGVFVSSHQLDQLAQIATMTYLMHAGKVLGPFPLDGNATQRYMVARSRQPGTLIGKGAGLDGSILLGSVAILPMSPGEDAEVELTRHFRDQFSGSAVTVEDLTLEQMLLLWTGRA